MKLHLGCGKRHLQGWHHRDSAEWEHLDSVGPVQDLSEFADDSVEQIYASHVLEYFDRKEAVEVLREWKRVLIPDGILRVAVPDFDALVEIYSKNYQIDAILGPLFGRMMSDGGMIYHRTTYNHESLNNLLDEAGFHSVKVYDPIHFLSNIDPDFDDHSLAFFPHMDRTGIKVSLCLQGRKSLGE